MKGDFSRNTFNKNKRFASVRMQQGRVQLDADWNEQMDIIDNRIRVGSEDFIGGSGAPSGNPGYKITPTTTKTDLTISKGRFYVQGILIENEKDFFYSSQTLPDKYLLAGQKADGLYLAYLDVWQQGVSAAIDSNIEEPALNGADTTMRVKNVAQVKLLSLPNSQFTGTALKCSTVIDKDTKNKAAWQTAIAASTGKLSAAVSSNANLKNQLYRVEIHNGGDQSTATFKWSRDNGALVGKITGINGTTITLANRNNQALNFKANQWVEITTNQRTLQNKPGIFVQLLKIDNNQLTIVNWPANTKTTELISGTVRQWNNNVTIINNDSNFTLLNVTNKKPVRNEGKIDITLANNVTMPIGLVVGKFIELSSSTLSNNSKRGYFAEVEKMSGSVLTLNDGANPISDTVLNTLDRFYLPVPGGLSLGKNNLITLENGLQIKFEKGMYKTGDYWLIPTRANTNNIASAQYDFKTPQLPEGIIHYHAQLALVRKTGTTWELADDCRNLISALGNKAYQSEPGNNEGSMFVDKTGNVKVKNELQVTGSAELKNGVTVTGETKTTSLTASGKTQTNSLQVDGSTALKQGATITGETKTTSLTVSGKTQTNSLQVDGSTALKQGAAITGETKTTSLTVSGKTQTNSLQVDESTALKQGAAITGETKTTSLTASGKTQTNSLQVDGSTALKQGVAITGETKTTSLTVSGKTQTNSLQVDGSTILKSSLSATGNVSAGSITTTGKTQTGSLQLGTSALINTITTSLSADSNTAVPTERAIKKYLDDLLIGSVLAFATTSVPAGWLECNGSKVSRTTYAKLYAKIGTTFGAGDGSNTFQLPDLRGEFIRGWDHSRGIDSGRAFANIQSDQMQSHKHNDSGHTHSATSSTVGNHTHKMSHVVQDIGRGPYIAEGNSLKLSWPALGYAEPRTGEAGSHNHAITINNGNANLGDPTSSTQGAVRHGKETRPRNVALMYCIKY